ncbi:hypothetical protein BATDEDRAFT_91494 [Batrachochytrium dendrobatidis JAM81]|uniref:Uncharacterized protein n=2 Tax=Batrachochytrium dendrobatidis TaxID=109871 RepID=F4PAV4_BATDJ|nr:uncharacterized protein BATDEDRAFT_91494 [Batrachochytrium dendrobatidis JAM81]EGF77748.1 hypothetical protein BATDEDRAFT_91494 [Batrachochytrium dendrobatidis JAM81]OAJ43186.1 hypothetical protein BDEG_26566 [Batrachochytrium dendrobatidis JEL423]|eukprot:XP_006681830.1 hypothetical protein BATDEDRAFT_91494 [Batrachochytrium dendrobatidis JAM81]
MDRFACYACSCLNITVFIVTESVEAMSRQMPAMMASIDIPLTGNYVKLREFQPICAVYPLFRSTIAGLDRIVRVTCLNCQTLVLFFSVVQEEDQLVRLQHQRRQSASQLWLEPLLPEDNIVILGDGMIPDHEIEKAKLDPFYSHGFHIIIDSSRFSSRAALDCLEKLSLDACSDPRVSRQLDSASNAYTNECLADGEARISAFRDTVYAELEEQKRQTLNQKNILLRQYTVSKALLMDSGLSFSPVFAQSSLQDSISALQSIDSPHSQETMPKSDVVEGKIGSPIDPKASSFSTSSAISDGLNASSQSQTQARSPDTESTFKTKASDLVSDPNAVSGSWRPPLPDSSGFPGTSIQTDQVLAIENDDQDEDLFEMEGVAARPVTKYTLPADRKVNIIHSNYRWRHRQQGPSNMSISLPIKTPNYVQLSQQDLDLISEEKAVAELAHLENKGVVDGVARDSSSIHQSNSEHTSTQQESNEESDCDESEVAPAFEPPHILSARTYAADSFLSSRPFTRKFSAL